MRFDPTNYKPLQDSSVGYSDLVHSSGAVVLHQNAGRCPCGCNQQTNGRSLFRQGHDAKLKGKLIRAHLAGCKVILSSDPAGAIPVTALALASTFQWGHYLDEAQGRQTARKVGRAVGSKLQADAKLIGSHRTIKVGRWEYDGIVLRTAGPRQVVVEYVTKKGETKTATVAR